MTPLQCRVRHLQGVYPAFDDDVVIIGVDVDPTESEQDIRGYAASRGYPWHMATLHRDVVLDYSVRSQSTKVGIDSRGVVVLRAGYGTQSAGEWTRWMGVLSDGD